MRIPLIFDCISLKVNILACFVNNKSSFKVHTMVPNSCKMFYDMRDFSWRTRTPKFPTKCTKHCGPGFLILSALTSRVKFIHYCYI